MSVFLQSWHREAGGTQHFQVRTITKKSTQHWPHENACTPPQPLMYWVVQCHSMMILLQWTLICSIPSHCFRNVIFSLILWVMICGLRDRVGGGSGLTRAMSLRVLVRSYWKAKHLVGLSSSRKPWWAGRLRGVALSLGTMWTLKSDLGICYLGELASNTWGNFHWVHSDWKGQDTDFIEWHWWQVALEDATSLNRYTF